METLSRIAVPDASRAVATSGNDAVVAQRRDALDVSGMAAQRLEQSLPSAAFQIFSVRSKEPLTTLSFVSEATQLTMRA